MLYNCNIINLVGIICYLTPKSFWKLFFPEWLTDYEVALSLAQKTNKIVLAHFTSSDVSEYCQFLTIEVYSKFEFIRWAKKNAVLLKVDFPAYKSMPESRIRQGKALKKKYGIRCYPTVLGLSSDGSERARLEGYYPGTGVSDWLIGFEKITMLTTSDPIVLWNNN